MIHKRQKAVFIEKDSDDLFQLNFLLKKGFFVVNTYYNGKGTIFLLEKK